jgi:Spy/CpxP family protein refolding chaperone
MRRMGVFHQRTPMNYRFFSPRRLAALLAVLLCLLPLRAFAQGFKWWHSDQFKQDLQLTQEQIAKIEEIFQAYLPDSRQQKRTLDRLEQELSHLIDAGSDEALVMQLADRVEAARSELSKGRTRMLLRMRRVLTPEQRAKLTALHQEWERRKRQDRRK